MKGRPDLVERALKEMQIKVENWSDVDRHFAIMKAIIPKLQPQKLQQL